MRLPLTVIGGYLGAGKTTLINRLLSEYHGLRLLVMVNDFGAINIDARLLKSATEDTLELSNGCVCCTMGADLFLAIGDVLDRPNQPDHLIIEASGIADPARIAQVALAEPDLAYGGIAVVVDAQNYDALSVDPQIGSQVRSQVSAADVLLVSKGEAGAWPAALTQDSIPLHSVEAVAPLIVGLPEVPVENSKHTSPQHPTYITWSDKAPPSVSHDTLAAHLSQRPQHLLRFKGLVPSDEGGLLEVHAVGAQMSVKPAPDGGVVGVIGIGLKGRITTEEIADWWRSLSV